MALPLRVLSILFEIPSLSPIFEGDNWYLYDSSIQCNQCVCRTALATPDVLKTAKRLIDEIN